MKRNNKKNRGFTLVEIMIVVLIIGILAAIAVPNFVKARESARRQTCIGNLTQINSAKEQWAMDQRKTSGDACASTDVAPAYIKSFPVCPAGGTYTVAVIGTNPSCTKSAAPDLHVLP
ncbi:MAG: prepilin-type N-terminal cleavage/methylation domain-containing protein [Armatimonadota bacterium]